MTLHWAEKYVGIPWSFNRDCASLVEQINNDEFNRGVYFPHRYAQTMDALTEQLNDETGRFAKKVDKPFEGDTLLMSGIDGVPNHVGSFFNLAGRDYVVHSCRGVGTSIITAVRDLKRLSFKPEGYYRWK